VLDFDFDDGAEINFPDFILFPDEEEEEEELGTEELSPLWETEVSADSVTDSEIGPSVVSSVEAFTDSTGCGAVAILILTVFFGFGRIVFLLIGGMDSTLLDGSELGSEEVVEEATAALEAFWSRVEVGTVLVSGILLIEELLTATSTELLFLSWSCSIMLTAAFKFTLSSLETSPVTWLSFELTLSNSWVTTGTTGFGAWGFSEGANFLTGGGANFAFPKPIKRPGPLEPCMFAFEER
jgi:hypothetical protein